MSSIRRLVPFLFPFVFVACGTTNPPGELVSARNAYARARAGDGQKAPTELGDARQALDHAEETFASEGDKKETRDLAYIAERKALRAEATGRTVTGLEVKQAAKDERTKVLRELALKGELDTKAAQDEALAERTRRAAAEKRAKDALNALAKAGAVKKEQRGTVITLPSSVLFETGKNELLPSAKERLSEVSKALEQVGDRKIVIEGHTDDVGSDADNLELSKARANTVREYLISRGVDENKISAVGKGESTPIENNKSTEGRAINRRVEIVVGGEAVGGGPK